MILEKGRKGVWQKSGEMDFFGGAVGRNPPADAGDTGSIPRVGRFHMLEATKSESRNC